MSVVNNTKQNSKPQTQTNMLLETCSPWMPSMNDVILLECITSEGIFGLHNYAHLRNVDGIFHRMFSNFKIATC